MTITVKKAGWPDLAGLWSQKGLLHWPSVFVLPSWLRSWWQVFGGHKELHLLLVYRDAAPLGAAPLWREGSRAAFIGSADLCDYLDFITAPGQERDFFNALLEALAGEGIREMELISLRPESAAGTFLPELAAAQGCRVSCRREAVSLEVALPDSWEEYLGLLNKKQRHEVRRKMRRLEQAGEVCFRFLEPGETGEGMDLFISMFKQNAEKASFLTPEREKFFRLAAAAMAEEGLLRLGLLEVEREAAAMVFSFQYRQTLYLYNSGYMPCLGDLSAGLLCKIYCLRDAVERGLRVFDFLKGSEEYKYRLGGREVDNLCCRIIL